MAVGIEPAQKSANAAVGQSDTGISGAIIEIDRVPVSSSGIAAGKYDILDVAVTLILGLGRKHPGVYPDQSFFRLLKIGGGQTQPVYGTRRRPSHTVIDHQPAP